MSLRSQPSQGVRAVPARRLGACRVRAGACSGDPLVGDQGSITPFVVVLTAALLAMAGLVVDGGYALAARQEAAATAEQAARAGADALARESLMRGRPIRINPAQAQVAVDRHLAAVGHPGSAAVTSDAVTVTVRVTRKTAILSAIGIDTLTATESATARGLTGIDREEPLPPVAGKELP